MKQDLSGTLLKADLARYGFMAVPLSFAGLPVYLHAPDFYARDIGLSLTTLGIALMVLRIVDAVQDPLIGQLSDAYSRWRRGIILAGVGFLAGGFWMIFNPFGPAYLLWFIAAVFICTTGFSIVTINLQTLGGLWHADAGERTRITGWREGFGLIGLLAAAIAPSMLSATGDTGVALHRLTLLFVPLLVVGTWLLFQWLECVRLDEAGAQPFAFEWMTLLSSGWARSFYGIVFVNAVASAIPAVLVILFIRDRLAAEAYLGLFLLVYFLSGVLAMPLWHRVAVSIGKSRAWAASMMLAIVTFGWALLIGPGNVIGFGIICALSGLSLGADLSLPPSLLADRIARKGTQTEAARHFSVMTFLSKTSLALATGLTLPLLGLAGYQPGAVSNPEEAGFLNIAYALVPCLIKAAALAWLIVRSGRIESFPVQPQLFFRHARRT